MARRKKSRAERVADAMSEKAKLRSGPADVVGQEASACWLAAEMMVRSKLHETTEQRRKRFEASIRKEHASSPKSYVDLILTKYADGCYADLIIDRMWDSFNSALDFTR